MAVFSSDDSSRVTKLINLLATIKSPEDMLLIMQDICTPAELKALSDRLHVLPYIAENISYRDIHQQTGVSITTVGRVARHLHHGCGGYSLLIDKYKLK